MHILLRKLYNYDGPLHCSVLPNIDICVLCFTERASLYNLVNKYK